MLMKDKAINIQNEENYWNDKYVRYVHTEWKNVTQGIVQEFQL